jgi:DnaJ-class molecular chaperone
MKDVTQTIPISKNTHNKTILRFEGLGHHGYRSTNGDLYITILVEQS